MKLFRPLGISGWLAVAAGVFLFLCLLAHWADIGSPGINLWWITRAYFGLTLLMSAVAFPLIAWDKMLAKAAKRRVPESTLHLVEILGGWPGSFIAQQMFRHKTLKTGYQVVFSIIATFHIVIVMAIFWNWMWNGESAGANNPDASVSERAVTRVTTFEATSQNAQVRTHEQFPASQDRRSG